MSQIFPKSTDAVTKQALGKILDGVVEDMLTDHPEIIDAVPLRHTAAEALVQLMIAGQRDPTKLFTYARRRASAMLSECRRNKMSAPASSTR